MGRLAADIALESCSDFGPVWDRGSLPYFLPPTTYLLPPTNYNLLPTTYYNVHIVAIL